MCNQVEVYRNLHNGRLSIRDAKTKLVVGHADRVKLLGVTFHVSQAGRKRVLREGRKNVHAVVRGHMVSALFGDNYKDRCLDTYAGYGDPASVHAYAGNSSIKYNPYKAGAFLFRNKPIQETDAVVIGIGGVNLAYVEESNNVERN